MKNFTEVNNCRCCLSSNLVEVLDLKDQPLANSYHSGEDQPEFPLKMNMCKNCNHLQLSIVVDPKIMFSNYIYVSGTSKTLENYFENFVDLVESRLENKINNKILDIACNDGSQLDKFKKEGWNTYGVDPAENLYPLSSVEHQVLCGFWDLNLSKKFKTKFDALVAQNVFAHVDNVDEFLLSCENVMHKDSLLFIQTSQSDMIQNGEFDTIYHEHLSFFNSKSMKTLANRNNFSVVDVLKTDIHGTSYVFVLKKGKWDESKIIKQIETEKKIGLFCEETYKQYAKRCNLIATETKNILEEFRAKSYKVVGYGAAAKANTFINFSKINLDYIVDDNPLKCGLKTPGSNIEIVSRDKLLEDENEKMLIIPLAWNFFEEIKSKTCETLTNKVKYLKYFPEVELVE